MTRERHEETLANRAELESAGKAADCLAHPEHVVFAMRDSYGTVFSIGMSTILQCLAFAIDRGELPKLPPQWVYDVQDMYRLDLTAGLDLC